MTASVQQNGTASQTEPNVTTAATEALKRLMTTAIEEAMEAVSQGETLIPFIALVDADGKLALRRFVDGTVEQAQAFLGAMKPPPVLAAIGADAYLNTEEGKQDAIIVQGYSPDLTKSLIAAQPYTPAVGESPAELQGGPQIINRGDNPLKSR